MAATLLMRRARLVPVAPRVGAAYAWRARTRVPRRGTTPQPGPTAQPGPVDLRIVGGVVTDVAPRLDRLPGEDVLDVDGRWALPGLWDQHVHLTQWASSTSRLDVSRAESAAQAADLVAAHVAAHPPAPGDVVEGFGFRDALWPDVPTRTMLDAAGRGAAVVLVSGDCHSGWVSTAAARALAVPAGDDLVREHPWFDAVARLASLVRTPDVGRALAQAAARGVVGVVDLEWAPNHRVWPERMAAGLDTLRVRAGVYPEHLDDVLLAGLRTGSVLDDGRGLLTLGPLKIISDGSLNTRTAACHDPYGAPGEVPDPALALATHGEQTVPAAELTALLGRATAGGLHAAIHAIGDRANTTALDVFAATGARGSIEHAQLLRSEDIRRFADLGVVASVQPAHLLDDRDVAEALWSGRTGRAYPLRDLLDAGAFLALGSDAPVAPLDPWLAMSAAVHRSADERPPWHDEQAVSPAEALAASTDGWGTLAPGHPGDLAVVDVDPLAPAATTAQAGARLRTMPVAATVVAGRLVHRAL
ncbi:amidohydrolase [Georgenia faecalis]|uniref:amidohydrolase n=1 Tax=Georgenia faecalis TaxID=2483799 RepID=UPI000FD71B3C|nr:amidohydrolase family protein [Georgenia faecalis]